MHGVVDSARRRTSKTIFLLAGLTACVLAMPWLFLRGPSVSVYATDDLTRLPVVAGIGTPLAAPESCVALRAIGDSTVGLEDEICGSPTSTFRVVRRVNKASECVDDADHIYDWSSQALSGAVCLDYDWTAGQCFLITPNSASKTDCGDHGAVRPSEVIIGAVDTSYCRVGGVPHPTRHFAVCTTSGNSPDSRSRRGI
jgi:hypothetical protein